MAVRSALYITITYANVFESLESATFKPGSSELSHSSFARGSYHTTSRRIGPHLCVPRRFGALLLPGRLRIRLWRQGKGSLSRAKHEP